MAVVYQATMPEAALLQKYKEREDYTDCFAVEIKSAVSQADFVYAFYTSPVFKIERFILQWLVAKPSTDQEAMAIAHGTTNGFAAWTVEVRADNQLLLCDYQNRTRSWLMSEPLGGGSGTRLYFGSAVTAHRPDGRRDLAFGWGFRLMLWFHKRYARALLRAAVANL